MKRPTEKSAGRFLWPEVANNLVAVSQAAHQVVVLDGRLGLLDASVAGAEGVAHAELHVALVEVAHAMVHIIALRDISLGLLVLVRDGISAQTHGQALVLEEGA